MPIYLVRWPRTEACLVRARNEDELRLLLDEVGDPSHARWTVYNGPFWIDVKLPADPVWADEGRDAVDVAAVVEQGERALQLRFGETEAGEAMREVVARWALPNVHGVLETMALEAEHEPQRTTGARALHWQERVERAVEADEAEMTVYVHQQLEREAKRRDPGQRFRQEELAAAVDRLAETLTRRRPSNPPLLTLVRSDDDER